MKKVILSLLVVGFFACEEKPKPTENAIAKADSLHSPALVRDMASSVSLDSLVIVVDSKGNISMGSEIANLEKLENKLTDSLQFLKKTYGKMPDTILLRTKGEVLMGSRGAIRDVIEGVEEKVRKN
jgi:hypothetical protein